jgi:hypothetical protein
MSGPPSLPPDVGRWPDDPYLLLGVSRRAAAREVRSAHDRLAAGFDPERHPEPRRRLRAARDAVLRDLERLLLLDSPLTLELRPDHEPAPPRPETPPDDLDLSEALRAATPTEAIAPAPRPSEKSPVVAAWQAALAGQEAEAYRSLVDLAERGATEDVFLRLYWLLTARPDLDRERSPNEWLARGLKAGGLSGPLWELYRRKLAGEGEEALSRRCARLFEAEAESGPLVELARLRWLAAARAQRWDVPAADLQALREGLPASERVAWARVWSAALDHLVWSDAPAARELAGQCLHSLRSLQSVAAEVGELQKRAMRLRDLAGVWRRLRSEPEVPPPLLALVPLSWSRPFAEVRPRLLAFLADALRAPRGFLRALDATGEQPPVLAEFGHMLDRLQETLPPAPLEARSSSDLAELTFAFLDTADRSTYRTLRPSLLDFCLREAVAPETVADLTTENRHYWLAPDRHLSEAISEDEPLSLAYLAHHLFWI